MMYIVFNDGECVSWHVGRAKPILPEEAVKVAEVQADGNELTHIMTNFVNIPASVRVRSQRWFGDMAKFIAANLVVILFLLLGASAHALEYKGTGYVKHKPAYHFLGAKLDGGVTYGMGASLVARPVRFGELSLGGTTSFTGGGVRVGAGIYLPWYVSPGISLEYGHTWTTQYDNLLTLIGKRQAFSYNYTNLYGTLGFGLPNRFMFRLGIGYSYVWGETMNLSNYIRTVLNIKNVTSSEAYVRVWLPSAQASATVYF